MRYLVFSLLFCLQAGAQQMPDYIVYLVKGEVTVHKGSGKPAKPKQHQLVYATETITIKQGGEVTLSDKNGSSFVLNTAGAYTVKSLSQRTAKSTDNLTKKYLNLLYHELIDPGHDYNKFKKQNVGGVWGGVSRSGECGNLLFPSNNMKTAELKLPFKWRKTSAANNYSLKIYDAEAKELVSLPVKDTSVVVDLTTYVTKPGNYYWRIQSNEANCEDETPYALHIISKEEESKSETAFQKIDASLMNQLAMVEILEKENMIWTAKKYLELLASRNNDPALAKTYSWFLLKYHFDEEAKRIWESTSPAGS